MSLKLLCTEELCLKSSEDNPASHRPSGKEPINLSAVKLSPSWVPKSPRYGNQGQNTSWFGRITRNNNSSEAPLKQRPWHRGCLELLDFSKRKPRRSNPDQTKTSIKTQIKVRFTVYGTRLFLKMVWGGGVKLNEPGSYKSEGQNCCQYGRQPVLCSVSPAQELKKEPLTALDLIRWAHDFCVCGTHSGGTPLRESRRKGCQGKHWCGLPPPSGFPATI